MKTEKNFVITNVVILASEQEYTHRKLICAGKWNCIMLLSVWYPIMQRNDDGKIKFNFVCPFFPVETNNTNK